MSHITEAYLMYDLSHRDQARRRVEAHRLAREARLAVRRGQAVRRSWSRWRT